MMRNLLAVTVALPLLALPVQAQEGAETQRTQALSDSGPPAPVRETSPCVVTRIIDGDTFECDPQGTVRPIGIDAPEDGQAPFDSIAKAALEALIPVRSRVDLELDIQERGRYNRLLAYVWADGELVNWVMVRKGSAMVYTVAPNVQWAEWFAAAQQKAREEGLGLWALGGFDCPPANYRQGRCK